MGKLADKVVEIARGYIGETELPSNGGWKDIAFQHKMEAVGWHKGEAWCCYTTELIWKEAFKALGHPLYAYLDKLFSGSTIATAANFKASPHFKTGQTPRKGAVAIYREGLGGWTGHAVIVEEVIPNSNAYKSIEGNTNKDGGREGIEVAQRKRFYGLPPTNKGLNLVCFIYLPE